MNLTRFQFVLIVCGLASPSALATNTSWSWNLTGSKLANGTGTFTACESTTKTYLTGTYARPSSGFVHMTLASTTGCQTCQTSACGTCSNGGGECSGVGTDIYAIELPGAHLIVQPVLTNPTVETQASYNIGGLTCPSSSASANFIVSQWGTGLSTSSTTQVGAGTLTWTSPSTLQISGTYNVQNFGSVFGGFSVPIGTCSGGTITATGTGDRAGTLLINSAGEVMYTTSANHRFFGVAEVSIPQASRLVGQYAGFYFTSDGTGVTPMTSVQVTTAANSLSGYRLNPSTGAADTTFSRAFTFNPATQLNAPVAGMIEGTLSDGTNTSNMICTASLGAEAHNTLLCVGQKPGATSTPANLLLTSTQSATFTSGAAAASATQVTTFSATQGTPQTAGPPVSASATDWVDASGNFWLFGGLENNSGGGVWNALWKFDGANWTWVKGASTSVTGGGDIGANYGAQNTAGATVTPGPRFKGVGWTDASGNLWQLGGAVIGAVDGVLMKFDGTNWTWVAPSSSGTNNVATYGTLQRAASTNYPGATNAALYAYDKANHLFWYMGGYGQTTSGFYFKNDLWRFDGTNWTWMSGSSGTASPAVGTYGTQGTPASANVPSGRDSSGAWVDGSGNFWIFGGDQNGSTSFNDLWKFDGVQWTWVGGASTLGAKGSYGTQGVAASSNWPGSRTRFGYWTDQAGNFWIMGGLGMDATSASQVYLNDVWKYDGVDWTWVAGSSVGNTLGVYGTTGTPSTTAFPGGRADPNIWLDSTYNVWIYGGYGYDSAGTLGDLSDMWQFSSFSDSVTNQIDDQLQISGRPYYNFGTGLSKASNYQYTATLTAKQAVQLTAVTFASIGGSGTLSFASGTGGGGSYPGGGTCGALPLSMAAGSSCTVVLNLKTPRTTGNLTYGALNVVHTVTSSGLSRTATLPVQGAD